MFKRGAQSAEAPSTFVFRREGGETAPVYSLALNVINNDVQMPLPAK